MSQTHAKEKDSKVGDRLDGNEWRSNKGDFKSQRGGSVDTAR
ncbi:hypothetical protein [Leptolyngbya sp. FACHB-711]|nr:hypothetical protein [Leptolyngbya sp. FACHB-711]